LNGIKHKISELENGERESSNLFRQNQYELENLKHSMMVDYEHIRNQIHNFFMKNSNLENIIPEMKENINEIKEYIIELDDMMNMDEESYHFYDKHFESIDAVSESIGFVFNNKSQDLLKVSFVHSSLIF
jgi:chromosome segregation ATPase